VGGKESTAPVVGHGKDEEMLIHKMGGYPIGSTPIKEGRRQENGQILKNCPKCPKVEKEKRKFNGQEYSRNRVRLIREVIWTKSCGTKWCGYRKEIEEFET